MYLIVFDNPFSKFDFGFFYLNWNPINLDSYQEINFFSFNNNKAKLLLE